MKRVSSSLIVSLCLGLASFGSIQPIRAIPASSTISAIADTTAIRLTDITRWIEEPHVTKSGKTTTKYFCVYQGTLVPTNKTTASAVALARKYNATIKLILITSKTGRRRIVLA